MAKNLMTNNSYNARAAGLIDSAVPIEMPQRCMSGIISSNRMLGAHIHRSPQSIKYDLYSKVAQIMNKDMFIFGRYHNLWH